MKNNPAPFSENQREYLDRSLSSWFNVAEGGKRGGKNVLATICFCAALEDHPNKMHLIAGVSISTAKLNVLDCDGFGVLNYFAGRCREGKYNERTCLYIKTRTGEKILLVSGGGKNGDEKLIKGNTYGMAYVTEANECTKNFIAEVFDRTLSSANRKIFHDLNPKPPKHWYYEDVLNFHEAMQASNPAYGYNYGHFTIADNMSISDEKLRAILLTYDKGSIWYRRDIKGLRCAAEGVIYASFAADPDRYLLDDVPRDTTGRPDVAMAFIGVDFGGTGSANAFICNAVTKDYKTIITVAEHYQKGKVTPTQLEQDFVRFAKRCLLDGFPVYEAFCDSAEQTLIAGIAAACAREKVSVSVVNARKGKINDRIAFYCWQMDNDRYKVVRRCKHLISALTDAVWKPDNPTQDERLDDGTRNVDSLDALEYSTEHLMADMIAMR